MSIVTTAARAVSDILDKGLADSTFRETYPDAYLDLLEYRSDLEASVVEAMRRVHQSEKKDINGN